MEGEAEASELAEAEEVAEAEDVVEATSSTSPEVGADAGARRGRPWRWRCGGYAKASISFLLLFFHVWMPDDLYTGCPRSRVLRENTFYTLIYFSKFYFLKEMSIFLK